MSYRHGMTEIGFARQEVPGAPVMPPFVCPCFSMSPAADPIVWMEDTVDQKTRRLPHLRLVRQRTPLAPSLLPDVCELLISEVAFDHNYTVVLSNRTSHFKLQSVDARVQSCVVQCIDGMWSLGIDWLVPSIALRPYESLPVDQDCLLSRDTSILWDGVRRTPYTALMLNVVYTRHPQGHKLEHQRVGDPSVQICVREHGFVPRALLHYNQNSRPSISFDLTENVDVTLPRVAIHLYQASSDETAWSGLAIPGAKPAILIGGNS
jgi:hypothetical protein